MIKAEIIQDSKNPVGNRLTTFILEYPRFVHAELMTHRVFSKNAASSRAIPIEKMIQQVLDNPAMPVWWGKNQSGMQANEELDDTLLRHENVVDGVSGAMTDKLLAKALWLEGRDLAIEQVKKLNNLGLHKQIANRILEPWFNIRIVLSGTEFENFFALRAHKDAQPEIRTLAYQMLDAYNGSTPKVLKANEWHIPFGDNMDIAKIENLIRAERGEVEDSDQLWSLISNYKKKIAIARCARISYLNYEGKDDYEADAKLCDRLFGSVPKHLSPTEHVAMALDKPEWSGNFRGFKQYRKFFLDESLKDNRIKK